MVAFRIKEKVEFSALKRSQGVIEKFIVLLYDEGVSQSTRSLGWTKGLLQHRQAAGSII